MQVALSLFHGAADLVDAGTAAPSDGFFTAPTIATLTGGAVGSLIAVAGAFLVAYWTVKMSQRREDEQRERDAVLQDAKNRQAVAAALSRVMPALESESRNAPFLAGRTQRVLLEAAIEGHRLIYRDHPQVAQWLLDRQTELGTMPNWSYRILVSRKHCHSYYAYATRVAEILADVQAWTIAERDDQWFADQLRSSGVAGVTASREANLQA